MCIVYLFDVEFLLGLGQFIQRSSLGIIDKFLKISCNKLIILFIFDSFIHSEVVSKTKIRKTNRINDIFTNLIKSVNHFIQLTLDFFKIRIKRLLKINTLGFYLIRKRIFTH